MGAQDTVGHVSRGGNAFIVFFDIDYNMIKAKLQVLACHSDLHLVGDKVITLLNFKPQHAI